MTQPPELLNKGQFAIFRVGRNAAPVFRDSLDEAIQVAKVSAEQSGGEHMVLLALGSVRAKAHWAAEHEKDLTDHVVAVTEEQPDVMRWPFRSIVEIIETHLGRTWEKRTPEPEPEHADEMGRKVNGACWTLYP